KHVLCEKPFDRRPDEVERAFDAAARNGCLLMEAFMYRHHLQTYALKQLVASGRIGRLRHIRTAFSFTLDDVEDVRLQPELAGGALDRKSTRLNSSHQIISYAVFCLKK